MKFEELLGIADVLDKRPIKGVIFLLLCIAGFSLFMYSREYKSGQDKDAKIAELNAKLFESYENAARAYKELSKEHLEDIKHFAESGAFADKQGKMLEDIKQEIKKLK